jgi:hypothetical protein
MVHAVLFPMLNISYFYNSPVRSMCQVSNMAAFVIIITNRLSSSNSSSRMFTEDLCCAV